MSSESSRTERFLNHLKPLQAGLETYCRRALLNSNEIEDTLQSVVALTFRDFDRFAEGTNFRAWIFRYLNLEIVSRNREAVSRTPQTLHAEESRLFSWEQSVLEQSFDSLLNQKDEILEHCDDALAQAVRCLPESERAVLLLRAVGDFRYREISEILKIPVGTVMSCLSRSRATLRRQLQDFARDRGIERRDGLD